jgi:hypothetical protein
VSQVSEKVVERMAKEMRSALGYDKPWNRLSDGERGGWISEARAAIAALAAALAQETT